METLQRKARFELGLLSHLGWAPWLGGDLAAVPVLLEMGINASAAGEALLQGLNPLFARNAGGVVDPQLSLSSSQPSFVQALEWYTYLLQAWQQLETLPPARYIGPRLNPLLDQARAGLPWLQLGLEVGATRPEVLDLALGLPASQRYLVLLQNPWELRPSGGFISALALVEVDAGRVVPSDFVTGEGIGPPVDELPPPPESMFKAMWGDRVDISNVNWSPDFPTSANWAMELYRKGRGQPVDGCIALDPVVIQYLLRATGPVMVPEYNITVSAEDWQQQLMAFHDSPPMVDPGEGSDSRSAKRKHFLPVVANAIISHIRSQFDDPTQLLLLAGELWRALDERHFLLYSSSPLVANWLSNLQWDGAIRHTDGDYLQIVDANVGFNKIDVLVEREVLYQVDLSPDGGGEAQVEIRYLNRSPVVNPQVCQQRTRTVPNVYTEGLQDACYWNYLRLYVPAGSTLLGTEPDTWPRKSLWDMYNPSAGDPGVQIGPLENDRQVFGLMVLVPPGKERTVHFSYALPPNIWSARDGYHLTLQKQSGTMAIPVHVDVRVPPNAVVLSSDGIISDQSVIADFLLGTDQELHLSLEGDSLAARPSLSPTHIPVSTPYPISTATATPTPEPATLQSAATPLPTPTQTTSRVLDTTPTPINLLVTATPTYVTSAVASDQVTWSHIEIPEVDIDAAVVEVGWRIVGPADAPRAEWEVAAYAAGHYTFSAYPGEIGNVVLSAHHNILGEVFRDLWELHPGDDIYLTDSSGAIYWYRTREVAIKLAAGEPEEEQLSQQEYMKNTRKPILTLVTCWPYETNTHRVFVIADYIGPIG